MPRTRKNIRSRKPRSTSSQGPSIVDLYGREDPSESEALVDGPTSSLSGEQPSTTSKSPSQQNEDEVSVESDAGWSEDNDMSSELAFSLSLSSSGNTNDEDGTISTKGASVHRDNNDAYDRYCLDDEEDDESTGLLSENGSSIGQHSENSSSSSEDSSSRSRTSSGRSDSAGESSSASNEQSGASDDSGHEYLTHQTQSDDDLFFASEFADEQDADEPDDHPIEAQRNSSETPKVRLFSTVDDFMERDARKQAARRFSLNDRAVFRLIDSSDNIDCAASDPGWGHVQTENVRVDRSRGIGIKNDHNSFGEDEFEALGWLDDHSGGGEGDQQGDSEVPRVVSADSSDNQEIDYGYGYDDEDELRDHTRNYDSRYDRDLSELVASKTDRSYRGEDNDSDEDSADNNTYMNRSVASYLSADNSSRSQPDPFLKPNVGNRPPTPPSPTKNSQPNPGIVNEMEQDPPQDIADDYHGLPLSPNLDFKQDEMSTSSNGSRRPDDEYFQEQHRIDEFASEFDDDFRHEQEYVQSDDGFVNDDFFPESLPQIDENSPVYYDHRSKNGDTFGEQDKSEIPFGNASNDSLVKKQRRDRKLIVFLAAGLVCALLALAAVLGGVIAAAVLRNEPVQVVEASASSQEAPPSTFPNNNASPQPDRIIPTKPPSKVLFTSQPTSLAPQSSSPTRSPTKSPISTPPTRAPTVQPTPNPTLAATIAPTELAAFGFGGPPSPTPPPTAFSGFGVAKIP